MHEQLSLLDTPINDRERYPTTRWARHNAKLEEKKRIYSKDNEKKSREQIVRERMRLEHIKSRERTNKQNKDARRKASARKNKK